MGSQFRACVHSTQAVDKHSIYQRKESQLALPAQFHKVHKVSADCVACVHSEPR